MTFGGGGLWISVPSGIERIDPQTGTRRLVSPVNGILTWSEAYGDLWVTWPDGSVRRIDTTTGDPVHFFEGMPDDPGIADVDGDTVWITDFSAPQLVRLNAVGSPDPHSVRLPVTKKGSSPSVVVAGAGAVWATTSEDPAVWRIDPSTNDVTRIPVPYPPFGVAVDDDAVWVTVGAGD
jgi:streptogramin lyase